MSFGRQSQFQCDRAAGLYAAKLSVPELREDRLLRSAVYAMHEMRGHERICEVPELRLAVRLKKGENDEIRT